MHTDTLLNINDQHPHDIQLEPDVEFTSYHYVQHLLENSSWDSTHNDIHIIHRLSPGSWSNPQRYPQLVNNVLSNERGLTRHP